MNSKARPNTDNGKDTAREARKQIADHKGAWRNRLLADRRVSNAAKVVGCAIAEHINRASKEATVGVRRLALILHMSQSQVSNAVHDLVDAGQLEVEWGVQGGGNNASTFKLVIDLETPDLFLFDKYELADFVEAEKGVLPAELSEVLPAELSGVLKTGHRSSKKGQSEFTKRAVEVLPAEQNPGNPGNPGGTPGVTTTDDDRYSTSIDAAENPAFDTVNDAPISAPDRPVPRAVARTEIATKKQPSPERDEIEMGPAANGADGSGFGRIRIEFERVAREYPRIADKAAALLAFNAAVGKRGVTRVVEEITNLMLEHGAYVPDLAEALAIIERDQAHSSRQ